MKINKEQREALRQFKLHLLKWNLTHNLVSKSQTNNLDEHIFDSLSIQPHLGKWSLPSGYVDRGEKVEEAAVREVKEEANLAIKLTGLIGIYSGKGPVILIVFRAYPINGSPSPGEEVSDISWFQINNLPELPFPFDDNIISDYKEVRQRT